VGILAPPRAGSIEWDKGARLAPMAALMFGGVAVTRSAAQLVAMGTYDANQRLSTVALAAAIDPGNYRIQLRLAQAYLALGDCVYARRTARSARALLPNAGEPKRILSECGSR